MNMPNAMVWAPLALDVMVIGLLGFVLWRLGRDPAAAWCEREQKLREIFDGLRTFAAQAEGVARDLDRDLAAREGRLRELLAAASAQAPATSPRAAAETEVAEHVRQLAAEGRSAEDIARRVGLAVAEVRLMIGLRQARAAAVAARASLQS